MVDSNSFHPSSKSENNEPAVFPHPYTSLPDGEETRKVQENHRRPVKGMLLMLSGFWTLVALMAYFGMGSNWNSTTSEEIKSPPPPLLPRGVAEGVSAKSWGLHLGYPSYPWTQRMLDWQRTGFHFQPNKNWMNDPNGPLYYKGWYHLFYQYNPQAAVWGNIVWGHSVSRDLIHWRHLPIAMSADQWYDINGVWTGSATTLPDGQVIMLYTGSTNEFAQVQNLAYPADLSDPFLVNWVKYPGNPVLKPPPSIHPQDFRDPTTAWATSEGKWRITIGSKINGTGISLVYETLDFKSYVLLDDLLHSTLGTGMWECVDFYPVSQIEENGLDTSVKGDGVKHVVKASFDDDRNDYYAIGTYNESSNQWVSDDPNIDVGVAILRYDFGKFYASKSFYDPIKKRRVLWGWIPESDDERVDIKKGWASLQAIPRTILFDKKTGSNLIQWPVEEIESLRSQSHEFDKVVVEAGSVVPLDVGSTTQLDIVAEFVIDKEVLERTNEADVVFSCAESGGSITRGALGPFGLLVLSDNSIVEQTSMYFYVAKRTNGNIHIFFCTDQSRSSEATDVLKSISGSRVKVLEGEKLTMRILVDHSIVEGFAQGGRTCITSRVYPTKAIYEDARIFLFNNCTEAKITASLKIWQMESAHSLSAANGRRKQWGHVATLYFFIFSLLVFN
ncbi:acid beta-fructofuranosidase-like [Rhododendron vialii]|uniref:acid beta-fructofuranosidase-like n=1 Tax=Rhododendron vialii TaxID=182163 RepID=UPI00265E7499|nr:acid beta-fructofuranosidase-like [Rhododendron vialii]